MTPAEFKAARETCGLSQADWAIALGYRSTDRKNLRQQINDMEGGRKIITPQVARLAEMFRRYGVFDGLATTAPARRGGIEMNNWQPIKTAPKDEYVIVFYDNKCAIAINSYTASDEEDYWQIGSDEDGWGEEIFPTHWMPIPKPPGK